MNKIKGKRCSVCHKIKKSVKFIIDPYDADVNDIIRRRNLCNECYDDLSDDI